MKLPGLVERQGKKIKGVLECFDRLVLFGTYMAIGWAGAMEQHLRNIGVRLLDYQKDYANALRLEMAGTRKYYLTKLGQHLLVAGRQLTERLIIPSFA